MSDSQENILEFFEEQKDVWEARATEGIEKYRKGDARITVTDQDGKPVSGVKIKLTQKSHEFRFGANLFMLDELETGEKNEKYKKYFADLFNMATLPFYWYSVEPEQGKTRYAKDSSGFYRRPPIDLCMEFCEQHGIEPREHGLAYDHFFPSWLTESSVDEIKRAMEKHFQEVSERYADKIRTIEVTNEMEWETGKTAIYDEPDYVEYSFKLAEKYFPGNQLVINEGARLAWGTVNRLWGDAGRTTDKYYAYIEANLLKGARIDAIGMQYHLFNYPRETAYEKTRRTLNPQKLYHQMDLYARFGKPLQITEVTVPAYSWEPEDEALQAELIEKLYTVWFSHPNVEQIIYWNLIDGYAYVDGVDPKEAQGNMPLGENKYYGGLLRFDLSPKPAYYKIKELTQKVWHTEEERVTDASGAVHFRGFYGNYELEIDANGKKIVKSLALSSKGERNHTITV